MSIILVEECNNAHCWMKEGNAMRACLSHLWVWVCAGSVLHRQTESEHSNEALVVHVPLRGEEPHPGKILPEVFGQGSVMLRVANFRIVPIHFLHSNIASSCLSVLFSVPLQDRVL